ncbi:MAG: hypothetical protein HQ546_04755, partial [Planctomycetes bacterium]|nr:hypothetical protein [Planctomycetota bacterium]
MIQILQRYDNQRTPGGSLGDLPARYTSLGRAVRQSDDIWPLVGAGILHQQAGDLRTAFSILTEAAGRAPRSDAPHYCLSRAYYQLAFFDMVDRGLCDVELVSLEAIPNEDLHHGGLHLEMRELLGPGRPAVYSHMITKQGFDQLECVKALMLLSWIRKERATSDQQATIESTAMELGMPNRLPVPKYRPDGVTKQVLLMAKLEMAIARDAEPMVLPPQFSSMVPSDIMEGLTRRIDQLLGESADTEPGRILQPIVTQLFIPLQRTREHELPHISKPGQQPLSPPTSTRPGSVQRQAAASHTRNSFYRPKRRHTARNIGILVFVVLFAISLYTISRWDPHTSTGDSRGSASLPPSWGSWEDSLRKASEIGIPSKVLSLLQEHDERPPLRTRDDDPLIKMAEEQAQSNPSIWNLVILAQAYNNIGNRKIKALAVYVRAAEAYSKDSEPWLGISKLCYDAYQWDLLARGKVQQSPTGLFSGHPDEQSRAMLESAQSFAIRAKAGVI